jgi:hypothetical protein
MKALWVAAVLSLLGCTPVQSAPIASPIEAGPSGISPGIVEVDNMVAGRIAEWPIEIRHGGTEKTVYRIYYQIPGTPRDGFDRAPDAAAGWVTMQSEITMMPRTSVEIPVRLTLPEEAEVPPQWEFWIAVQPEQFTNVQYEWCSRWLVKMRD